VSVRRSYEYVTAQLDLEPYLCQIDLAIPRRDTETIQAVLGAIMRKYRESYNQWRKALEKADFSTHNITKVEFRALIKTMGYYGHVKTWPKTLLDKFPPIV